MAYKPYRPPHWYDANQTYFLTASTFDRQRLFLTGDDKTRLHGRLVKQSRRFGLRLYAWVILDNHYHLLLRNSAPTALARFVKAFHSESAVAWNRRHDTPGRRVWHNYWDRSPRGRRDYFAFFNYIHFNPVKHGHVRIGSEFVRSYKNRWHLDRSRGDDFCDAFTVPVVEFPVVLEDSWKGVDEHYLVRLSTTDVRLSTTDDRMMVLLRDSADARGLARGSADPGGTPGGALFPQAALRSAWASLGKRSASSAGGLPAALSSPEL